MFLRVVGVWFHQDYQALLAIPVGDVIWFCMHSFFFFFPPRFCSRHISGTVTRRDSKLSVLLGHAV